jgi:hypothetical protein
LQIDDLPVYGFGLPKPDAVGEFITGLKVSDLSNRDLANLDAAQPKPEDQHEAAFFRRSIDAIDNLVRFLRGVELRAEDYRRLQADAAATRQRMQDAMQVLAGSMQAINTRLAEVRHDLSVALALRAEEATRLVALVERRRAVLRDRVEFLVFRRPRLTHSLADVPRLALQPSAIDDPVPRCRQDDDTRHSPPAELLAMVDTLKDVPSRWWRPMRHEFYRFDRLDDLQRLADEAGKRLGQKRTKKLFVDEARSFTGKMIEDSFDLFERRLEFADEKARKGWLGLEASNWKQAQAWLQDVVAVRDILVAAPASHPMSLLAARLLDDVGGVAACLHAALCETPATQRLKWANTFSQLDRPLSLRQLSSLPGFGQGLGNTEGQDMIAWRRMQSMVDWLFAQVADEAEPVQAIDDLVRVCVLLAAHAPVKRIISARLRRPAPAVPGAVLDLAVDPKHARVGLQVLVHAAKTKEIIARGVVHDMHAQGVIAHITQVMTAQVMQIDASMQVQLQQGPALSTPAAAALDVQALKGKLGVDAEPGASMKSSARSWAEEEAASGVWKNNRQDLAWR